MENDNLINSIFQVLKLMIFELLEIDYYYYFFKSKIFIFGINMQLHQI